MMQMESKMLFHDLPLIPITKEVDKNVEKD